MRATAEAPSRSRARAVVVALSVLLAVWMLSGVAAADVYSGRAGFADAKVSAGAPAAIRVWKPAAWSIRLSAAIRGWNRQAGRTLFERTRSEARADVILSDGADVGWAAACYDAAGIYDMEAAYDRCTIFVPFHGDTDTATWSLIHEMGHTLGFVDHVHASLYARFVREDLDPRVCDDPSHPAYSPYQGIMSECRPADRFKGDAAALVRAGYATVTG